MANGLNLQMFENVFASAEDIFQQLENNITYLPTKDCKVVVKGKSHTISRQIAAFGDPEFTYTFASLTIKPQQWTPFLSEIKKVVENLSGHTYNFVFVNRFQNGNAHTGQHKDDENSLEENSITSTLSLGESRSIVFKRPTFEDKKIELKSNSILLMKSPTNSEWSHGIPREKKRTGTHINLTFLKMKIQTQKRKNEGECSGDRKQVKTDNSKDNGIFKEDEIPRDVFCIGESVFVYPRTFRGEVALHIRKFTKYGETFYPTSEDVTLQPNWINFVIGRKEVPQSAKDLGSVFYIPEDQFAISSMDFINFTFTRFKYRPDGGKSITISKTQWAAMLKIFDNIVTAVLDHIFSAMDFFGAYSLFAEGPIETNLPISLDASLGTQYLQQILENVFCDLMKEEGLKMPEELDGEVLGHRIRTFNSAAFSMKIDDIADYFFGRLWSNQNFLLMKPAMYVTEDFLKTVRLNDILIDVRSKFCPHNISDFYEDLN